MIPLAEIWQTLRSQHDHDDAPGAKKITMSWLPSWSVIEVSGQDAQPFLNSQLSNAIELDTKHVVLSAWCTPAGRVICTIWVCARTPHHFLLLCPTELGDACLNGLQRFVLRRKVSLHRLDETIITAITVHDSMPAQWRQQYPDINCGHVGQIHSTPDYTLVFLTTSTVLFIGGMHATTILWTQATQTHYAKDEQAMQSLLVDHGWPLIQKEVLREKFIPQMLNFDLIHGLSFQKGCYPGQEIVARTQYLGKTKRRTYCFTAHPTAQVHIGQAVLTQKAAPPVGQVIVFYQNTTSTRLLAVLACVALPEPLHLADGPPITLGVLPYAIP